MADETIDLGRVELIQADAVGVPGQRRFRLRARTATDFALLWVEREQTQALGNALAQLLGRVQLARRERPVVADAGGPLDSFPPSPTIEFTVGRLGLGFDEERDLVIFEVSDIEANVREEEDETSTAPERTLVFRASRPQAVALREQCEATLSAGRPRCTLCGAPMEADGTHFCIRANGHQHHETR